MNFRITKKLSALVCVMLVAANIAGCGSIGKLDTTKLGDGKETSTTSKTETTTTTAAPAETPTDSSKAEDVITEPTSTASLVCVGDNLIHDNIYVEALSKGGGSEYDFTDCYAHIADYIKGTDVAIINQETLVTDSVEPCSYPTFASPTAVGDKVVDLGFNVVSMCNNHVLDKGEAALDDSLSYWDSKGVVHYGAYKNKEDSENIRTMEVNGITFAFLGYMEHTNGITPSGDETVTYLDDETAIKAQVEEADKMADVVVVSCHFGTEISNELNQQQQEMTPKLVEWGADLIIGTQAHALSTCEYLDKADGTKAFVFYGLGNFFSTMYDPNSLIGLMGKMNVVKDNATGEISFEDIKAIPVISHFEATSYDSMWYNCAVYPYAEYTDDLFALNYVKNDGFNREYVDNVLNTYVPSEFLSIE